MTFTFSKEVLQAIAAHAQACYPNECCGVLLGDLSGCVARSVAVENMAQNPKDSYEIEPFELDRIYDEARKLNLKILGVYHSHIEVGAYFSSTDRHLALSLGEPTYSLYVVASVRRGHCDEIKSFTWSGYDFIEELLGFL
jgi:proteasome lid subunit RPN8/RPN11